jgi:hypothetical protein
MYTLLAAAALAACMGGPGQDCGYQHRCFPGFASAIENGALVTPPPEDATRVYTPGISENSGRLWFGSDVKDLRARRAWRHNPGKPAFGAAGPESERAKVRVGHLVVSVSPWDRIEEEGLENLERGRQQWLAERGYTGGVRTFVNPARTRAIVQQRADTGAAACAPADAVPQPSATIRLRNPGQKGGINRRVDAGVAGGVKVIAGEEPVRISWPMGAKAEAVERSIARGWTESEEGEPRVADSR